ncbi:ATP-grasp domain protein [Anaerococcus hydrogenalis DSM 7454]|uniref:ATP-grasp domain protein n=1 Tax=Anaerococcus hydrogenalis DSM 7454 TaxID=561177 RepID=B6W7G4_9FIRM|nr:ATP-grasp domain-containing protein [Anaerococcus hydrogenalis]EEB36707.1 ATP-grasp domain protein [Anaerococcus hydrogenalis DSM 7454]
MKKLMILGASVLQIPAIVEAKKLGLYVIAVDMNPNAEGFSYADKKIVVSTTDTEKVLEEAKKNKIDGIITIASDRPMTTVAKVAKELDLIGIDEKTAINATNKSKMRDALKAYGVPIPMYFSVEDYDQYIKAIDNLRNKKYKCIVKPADNSGSRGIRLVENYDIDQLKKIYDYCKKNSSSGKLVVEEYMQGPEVSVETISRNGTCNVIQITDKLTTGAPYFVEMGHNQPSQLPIDIIEKIKKVAIDANKAVGIENGPSHTEIKVTKDGPKIVELGARLGGDNITTHLVPYSTGINMVEASIKIALGEEIDITKKINMASAARYKKCDIGKIIEISGIDEAREVSGIKDIKIVHKAGDYSNVIKSSNDRVCYVISQENSVKEAIESCEKALEKIKVRVQK